MSTFDSDLGMVADDVETVRASVQEAWQNAFSDVDNPALNVDPSTPQGQLIDSQTAAIVDKDNQILYLSNMFNPLTSEGIWQDALAQIYFITRQSAIASSAVCTCTGRVGTVIEEGAIIENADDGTQWKCAEAGTIPQGGTIDLTFECTETGAISAAAGTLTKIVTVIAGWDAVTNADAATVGQSQENQGTFEARRYKSVALNSRSAVASVYSRVGQVEGVLSLYVNDNKSDLPVEIDGVTLAPHSVFVSVTGGDDYDVAKAIYNSISAGCAFNGETEVEVTDDVTGARNIVKFNRPENLDVGVKVTLRGSDDLPANAEEIVREAVYGNFYGTNNETQGGLPVTRVSQGDDLYASRFYPSIVNQGVNYILSIQVSDAPEEADSWQAMIHIPINYTPVLTDYNITVDIETE